MIAGILFLTVFVVGLIVGSIMARRKHPPVDSARFGTAVQHLYGQRSPDITVKVQSNSKRPMPVK